MNAPPASKVGLWSWAVYDWANSAFPTVVITFLFPAYFVRQVASTETGGTTLWGLTLGTGGTIVALGAPVLGAIADQAGRRKLWIGTLTTLAVVGTSLLWFVRPAVEYQWLGLALAGIGAVGISGSEIFYNAMLPAIAPEKEIGRWSGRGWALGYAGGMACLVLVLFTFFDESFALFPLDTESAQPVRASFILVAVWIASFAIPMFVFTPDAPPSGKSVRRIVADGFGQVRASLANIRRYNSVLPFLVANFLYKNGIIGLFLFGGVFAAGTFNMSEEQVLRFGIGLNVTAALGAAAFSWVDDLIGSRKTILIALTGVLAPAVVILLTKSETAFRVASLILGALVGPVQAASRSFMARIAPADQRNEMFGLYALVGKATTFLGPLAVAGLTHITGSQRAGMSSLLVFLALGLIAMVRVHEQPIAAESR